MNAEQILLEAFIVCMEDGEWEGQFEDEEDDSYWGLTGVSLYCRSSSHSGVGKVEVC